MAIRRDPDKNLKSRTNCKLTDGWAEAWQLSRSAAKLRRNLLSVVQATESVAFGRGYVITFGNRNT
ncbi:MAG: hypothetical protein DWI22_09005 [Planctomycetota bacterium]|nr:MAG: hypothetical protein DWI22_09005 [Planctomycetota bacterium]